VITRLTLLSLAPAGVFCGFGSTKTQQKLLSGLRCLSAGSAALFEVASTLTSGTRGVSYGRA
jgi:hypothetical protein